MPKHFRTRMRWGTVPLVLTMVSVVLIGAAPGDAHTASTKDGNDTAGSLDLASVSVTHEKGSVIYTFKTFKRFKPTTLAPNSYFVIAMDRNRDAIADRCAFFYESGSRFHGQLTNCGRKYIDALAVKHPSPRAASITLSESLFSGTYTWRAFSFCQQAPNCGGDGCVDAVPNKGVQIHDLTPPTLAWVTSQPPSSLSTNLSLTTSVPVEFTTDDDRRVTSWVVRRSTSPVNATWETLVSGTTTGDVDTDLQLAEGQVYALKAFATDQQGNEGGTPTLLNIAVPVDDQNATTEYTGTWTSQADSGAFQGSRVVSTNSGSTITFTVPIPWSGAYLYVMGGPGNGSATLCNGCPTLDETPSTPNLAFVSPPMAYLAGGGEATVTVTVVSGSFTVDAIAIVPK